MVWLPDGEKKIKDTFGQTEAPNVIDRRTVEYRMTAQAALMQHRAAKTVTAVVMKFSEQTRNGQNSHHRWDKKMPRSTVEQRHLVCCARGVL